MPNTYHNSMSPSCKWLPVILLSTFIFGCDTEKDIASLKASRDSLRTEIQSLRSDVDLLVLLEASPLGRGF